MTTYPLHEQFTAFQGEGPHAGLPAHFLRLYGCPLRCTWCDSAGTWHAAHRPPAGVHRYTAAQLADHAAASGAPFVVVTGGEPTVYDLSDLTSELRACGLGTHLETSGAFPLTGTWDHITVSPKWARPPRLDALELADTVKLIIEHERSVRDWEAQLGAALQAAPSVYLHPEWSQRENPAVLNAITAAVLRARGHYRAGWQLHKLYACDQLDARSAPTVPLGGKTE